MVSFWCTNRLMSIVQSLISKIRNCVYFHPTDSHTMIFGDDLKQTQTQPSLMSGVTLTSSAATYCPHVCRTLENLKIDGFEVDLFRQFGRSFNFNPNLTDPGYPAWALFNGTQLSGESKITGMMKCLLLKQTMFTLHEHISKSES